MRYSPKRFTALLLALIMVLSVAPLDAVASVFTTYEANIIIDTSDAVQIGEAVVASEVKTKDGFSVVVSSIDEILPAEGWVGFKDEGPQAEAQVIEGEEVKAEEETLQPALEEAEKVPVETEAHQDDTDLVEKLKPVFYNNEADVRLFLKEISGMKPNNITDLVNRWIADKRISDYGNSRKGVFWEILHDARLYTRSRQNWCRRVY